jgi:hypothetical protein
VDASFGLLAKAFAVFFPIPLQVPVMESSEDLDRTFVLLVAKLFMLEQCHDYAPSRWSRISKQLRQSSEELLV